MGAKNINFSSRRYQKSSKGRTTQAETHEKNEMKNLGKGERRILLILYRIQLR